MQLMQDPSRHGVVKWLENLPEVKSLIAGVELVSIKIIHQIFRGGGTFVCTDD